MNFAAPSPPQSQAICTPHDRIFTPFSDPIQSKGILWLLSFSGPITTLAAPPYGAPLVPKSSFHTLC